MLRKTARGFTLVELLIVIALIGVLAVAVLAAINPLEQLNRARDTGMESDASQLLAAIDRYYASQERFPWVIRNGIPVGGLANNDAAFGFVSARDPLVGICSEATCNDATPGLLLQQFELKTEFMHRRFIEDAGAVPQPENLLYIGKAEGGSQSVYACWIPTSNAQRQQAIDDAHGLSWTTGETVDDRTCSLDPDVTDWTEIDEACYRCIPR